MSRRPRFEVVDAGNGAVLLDHSARVGYPFQTRKVAEYAAVPGAAHVMKLYGPNADATLYRTAKETTE